MDNPQIRDADRDWRVSVLSELLSILRGSVGFYSDETGAREFYMGMSGFERRLGDYMANGLSEERRRFLEEVAGEVRTGNKTHLRNGADYIRARLAELKGNEKGEQVSEIRAA